MFHIVNVEFLFLKNVVMILHSFFCVLRHDNYVSVITLRYRRDY